MYRTRKARRRKKREARGFSTHHIYAISRFKHLRHKPWNKVRLPKTEHELYHQLFGTRTPEEILAYLHEHFWGGCCHVSTMSHLRPSVARTA